MTIEVLEPDGNSYEFPDGTSPDVMRGAMQKRFPKPADVPGVDIGGKSLPGREVNRYLATAGDQADGNSVDMAAWSPEMKREFEALRPKDYGNAVAGRAVYDLPFFDEISAGISAPIEVAKSYFSDGPAKSLSQEYDNNLEVMRALQNDVRSKGDGWAGFGASLAGNIALPLGVGGKALEGGNLLTKMARGAGVGGAYGALYGAGEGEGWDRVGSAASGAGFGILGGAAAPAVGNMLGKAYAGLTRAPGKVASKVRGTSDVDEAFNRVADKLDESGFVPGDIQKKVRDAASLGLGSEDVPVMLADMSKPLTRLAGTVNRSPGKAGEIVEAGLRGRQVGTDALYGPGNRDFASNMADAEFGKSIPSAYQRMKKHIAKALDVDAGEMADFTKDRVITKRRDKANKYYKLAYSSGKPFTILRAFKPIADEQSKFGDKGNRALLQRAMDLFYEVDPTTGQRVRMLGSGKNDLELLDVRKRELDKMIGDAKPNRLTGSGDANIHRILTTFKNNILSDVDKQNGAYRTARSIYKDDSDYLDAIDAGRDALKGRPEITERFFDKLDPVQKRYFQLGTFDAMKEVLDGKVEGADMTAILQNNKVRALLNKIIPAGDIGRFGKAVEAEMRMKHTENKVLRSSETAERLAADGVEKGKDALAFGAKLVRGDLAGAAMETAKNLVGRFFGFRADVAENLARILTTMDKPTLMDLAAKLDRHTRSRRGTNMVKTYLGTVASKNAGAIGGVVGGQAARPTPQQIP